MCTSAEPASQGQDAAAGAGRKGATPSAIRPDPAATATVSRPLSSLALTSAFHVACSSAAASTASVTGSEISMRSPLADHLLDERPHALDRGASLLDRFFGAMEVHGAKSRQQRRKEDIGWVAGKAAARDAHLDDIQRGGEHLEDRRHPHLLFDVLRGARHPAAAELAEPAGNLARSDRHVDGAIGQRVAVNALL